MPSKKKRRRSVSMKTVTYWRLKQLARLKSGRNPTDFMTQLINERADAHQIPTPDTDEAEAMLRQEAEEAGVARRPNPSPSPNPHPKPPEASEEIVSQHFTF